MKRRVILEALARGDGQTISAFDLGHTAEMMYGDQADQIELQMAVAERDALIGFAQYLEAKARTVVGASGDRIRREVTRGIAADLRETAKETTRAAQRRFEQRGAERRAALGGEERG